MFDGRVGACVPGVPAQIPEVCFRCLVAGVWFGVLRCACWGGLSVWSSVAGVLSSVAFGLRGVAWCPFGLVLFTFGLVLPAFGRSRFFACSCMVVNGYAIGAL